MDDKQNFSHLSLVWLQYSSNVFPPCWHFSPRSALCVGMVLTLLAREASDPCSLSSALLSLSIESICMYIPTFSALFSSILLSASSQATGEDAQTVAHSATSQFTRASGFVLILLYSSLYIMLGWHWGEQVIVLSKCMML